MSKCETGKERTGGEIKKYITTSPEETEALGKEVSGVLQRGDIVALVGELGGGKTCFVRGLARGLGLRDHVKSPSFNVLNIYDTAMDGRKALPLYHMDLYRLTGEGDFFEAGLEEYIYSQGVSVIEWADKLNSVIKNSAFVLRFTYIDENRREIILEIRDSERSGGNV